MIKQIYLRLWMLFFFLQEDFLPLMVLWELALSFERKNCSIVLKRRMVQMSGMLNLCRNINSYNNKKGRLIKLSMLLQKGCVLLMCIWCWKVFVCVSACVCLVLAGFLLGRYEDKQKLNSASLKVSKSSTAARLKQRGFSEGKSLCTIMKNTLYMTY